MKAADDTIGTPPFDGEAQRDNQTSTDVDALRDDETTITQESDLDRPDPDGNDSSRESAERDFGPPTVTAETKEICKMEPAPADAKENVTDAVQEIQIICLADIEVLPNRRALDEEPLAQLVASMSTLGLQTPITLNRDPETGRFVLVAGAYRLEAARRLGWLSIGATVVEWTPERQRMGEIAENLHRAELTTLERSEQIAEWIRLLGQAQTGEDSGWTGKVAPSETVSKGGRGKKGGVREAARGIGVDRNDAHRAMKVAGLSEEAKQTARELGLDNNRSVLSAAAKAEDSVSFLRDEHARRAGLQEQATSGKSSGDKNRKRARPAREGKQTRVEMKSLKAEQAGAGGHSEPSHWREASIPVGRTVERQTVDPARIVAVDDFARVALGIVRTKVDYRRLLRCLRALGLEDVVQAIIALRPQLWLPDRGKPGGIPLPPALGGPN